MNLFAVHCINNVFLTSDSKNQGLEEIRKGILFSSNNEDTEKIIRLKKKCITFACRKKIKRNLKNL